MTQSDFMDEENPLTTEHDTAPRNQHLIACIGWCGTFGNHLGCYERAVNRLFQSVDSGAEPIDLIAPPLLNLMRHSLELGYKFTLWELHQMLDEKYDSKTYKSHRLEQLHTTMKEKHAAVVLKYDLPESEVQNFAEYCEKTETGIKHFSALDPYGYAFRYPIDNQGKRNFTPEQQVDLVEIKKLYDESMILLRHTADVLGEYVDIYQSLEADYELPW